MMPASAPSPASARSRRRGLLAAGLGLLLAGSAFGRLPYLDAGASAHPVGPLPGQVDARHTLHIGRRTDPETLDPALSSDPADWVAIYPCYQHLMRYAKDHGQISGRLEGDLAERWESSPDGLVWSFRLRARQAFDDGSPVDAVAVRDTFERLLRLHHKPALRFPRELRVEVVAPLGVRFVLARPWPGFLEAMASNGAGIVNPRVLDRPEAGPEGRTFLANHSAGSGPYRLAAWERNRFLALVPNPHFGGPVKPMLQQVRLEICRDPMGMRLLLENGGLDIAEGLPENELELLVHQPLLTLVDAPSFKETYLYLNHRRPPLDQPVLRQALSWAVD